jgi:hypothetical protein
MDDAFQFEMLSDDEWRKVRAPLDLQDSYRPRIGKLVVWYRFKEGVGRDAPNAKTREDFEKAREAARVLRQRLEAFDQPTIEMLIWGAWEEDKFDALNAEDAARWFGPGPRPHVLESAQPLQMLNRLLGDLPQLESLLGSRASEIKRRPTRSRRNLDRLVQALDVIVHEQRTGITRSVKSNWRLFVDNVVCVADPHIGPGSVDEAMKAVIKKRPKQRRGRLR